MDAAALAPGAVAGRGLPVSDQWARYDSAAMPCQAEGPGRVSVRQNRVVLTPAGWRQVLQWCGGPTGRAHQRSAGRRGQKCIAPRGERDISRKPTAQGRPVIGLHLCLPCERLFTHHCTGARGCQPVPGLPCALPIFLGRQKHSKARANDAAGSRCRVGCLTVEEADGAPGQFRSSGGGIAYGAISPVAILRDARRWRALRMRIEGAAPVSTGSDGCSASS